MKDAIGNQISQGNLLLWPEKNLTFKVIAVDDGDATIVTKHERPRMAMITLAITIPVDMSQAPRGAEPALGGFFRIVDPAGERVVAEAAGIGIVKQ